MYTGKYYYDDEHFKLIKGDTFKVLKKFESLNVSFVRDEIKGLIEYIEKTFGKTRMEDSRAYLLRIQNLY